MPAVNAAVSAKRALLRIVLSFRRPSLLLLACLVRLAAVVSAQCSGPSRPHPRTANNPTPAVWTRTPGVRSALPLLAYSDALHEGAVTERAVSQRERRRRSDDGYCRQRE